MNRYALTIIIEADTKETAEQIKDDIAGAIEDIRESRQFTGATAWTEPMHLRLD